MASSSPSSLEAQQDLRQFDVRQDMHRRILLLAAHRAVVQRGADDLSSQVMTLHGRGKPVHVQGSSFGGDIRGELSGLTCPTHRTLRASRQRRQVPPCRVLRSGMSSASIGVSASMFWCSGVVPRPRELDRLRTAVKAGSVVHRNVP